MLKITVVAVGKLKETWWQEAQAEYLRRLTTGTKMTVVEVAAEALNATITETQAMRDEGMRLLRRLPEAAYVVALERTGRELSSPELATLLKNEGGTGREIVFVIGGSAGLDEAVLARANKKISLSHLTFVHEMARVILLEQLYRVTTILSGKPYHR